MITGRKTEDAWTIPQAAQELGLAEPTVCPTLPDLKITIETKIAAPLADTWRAFNDPDDIVQWDASEEWHTTWASNDLTVGGKLRSGVASTSESATSQRVSPHSP